MKSIKTVNLKANEIQAVEMPNIHCHVRNGGTATVFASRYSDVTPYTDGVLEIKSGDSKVVRNIFDYQTRQGFVYLFSESDTSVELESANDVNFFSRKIISGGESTGSVDTYNRSEINAMLSEKADNSDLKTVAKTGSYNDLSDKPEIPVVDVDKSYVDNALKEKADNSDVEEVSNAVNTHINNASIHMTADEKEKLTGLENYDDTEIKANIAKKVDQKDGYSLVSDTEITRLAEVKNYDDTQIKNDIALNTSSVGMSKKNLLRLSSKVKESNGITCTVNTDGSITLTGTNAISDNTIFYFDVDSPISVGEYLFTGRDELSVNKGEIRLKIGNTTHKGVVGGTLCQVTSNSTVTQLSVWVWANQTVNCTLYPMLRYADITDDTYEPYTPSLQEQVTDIQADICTIRMTTGTNEYCIFKFTTTNRLSAKFLICGNSTTSYGDVFVNVCFSTARVKKYLLSGTPTVSVVIGSSASEIYVVIDGGQYCAVTYTGTVLAKDVGVYATSTLPEGTTLELVEL